MLDQLWITAGANGNSGTIRRTSCRNDSIAPRSIEIITAPGADAIEGVVKTGSSILIANDAGIHGGATPTNQILDYAA